MRCKKPDMTPFDTTHPPAKQNPLLLPLIWMLSYFQTRKFKLKIRKINMKGLKPPYILLSTHQGESDYAIVPLALFPHRANYISDMEGFAVYGKWLYRQIGCIAKRRFVPDYSVIRHSKTVLFQNKNILVLFPEARHSNIGTTAQISETTARLIKRFALPVATLSIHGSYLANPFWDEKHTRKSRMEATLSPCFTQEELQTLSLQEIQARIQERLHYDEYQWQKENRIKIADKNRAEGLHLPLYQCPSCRTEYKMDSRGDKLFCKACGKEWFLNEYGKLNGAVFTHPPEWYEWQRNNTEQEIALGNYAFTAKVRIEALPNEKGFLPLGTGRLTHTPDGFLLEGESLVPEKQLFFPSERMESLQTEYHYRGKDTCVVLSTRDCCYYLYPEQTEFSVTKIQFAAEYLHRIKKKRKKDSDK